MNFKGLSKSLLIFAILLLCVDALNFDVDGEDGWVVPSKKNEDIYNQWASKNRFRVGDTIHFKYKKDSVMIVNEDEYNECDSSHPTFFSNNGGTNYTFETSGLFYFISGVTGHCELGQKMIIKVLSSGSPPPSASSPPPPSQPSDDTPSAASRIGTIDFLPLVIVGIGTVLVCGSLILA